MNLDPSSLLQKPTNHSGTCRLLDFLWLRSLFSGEHLMVEVIFQFPSASFFLKSAWRRFIVLLPILCLCLVTIYSVTVRSQCPVCFKAQQLNDRAFSAPESLQRMCEWGRKVKKTGVIDSESLEHSVKGYGQMTWANVSQWCVHLSILVTSRTDGVEIALQDQSEESAASFNTARPFLQVQSSCYLHPLQCQRSLSHNLD